MELARIQGFEKSYKVSEVDPPWPKRPDDRECHVQASVKVCNEAHFEERKVAQVNGETI